MSVRLQRAKTCQDYRDENTCRNETRKNILRLGTSPSGLLLLHHRVELPRLPQLDHVLHALAIHLRRHPSGVDLATGGLGGRAEL